MNIPAIVREAVDACGSVSELARRLGVSRQTVHAWLSGASEPRARHLVELIGQIPGPGIRRLSA